MGRQVVVTNEAIRQDERVKRAEDAIRDAAAKLDDPLDIIFEDEGRQLLGRLAQMRVMAALQLRKDLQ